MNVLHLALDEKFIDFFWRTMKETSDCSHRFLIHTPDLLQPLTHVRQVTPNQRVDDSYFSSARMKSDLASCDALVVHFLTPHAIKMINAAPRRVIVVWSGWGADYHHLLRGAHSNLLGPETRSIASELKTRSHPTVIARYTAALRRRGVKYGQLLPAIRRVNFFSAPIPDDYLALRASLGWQFTATYIQLNYGSVNDTFAVGGSEVTDTNILVGNSASFTNNHVEVFRLLKRVGLGDRKAIVPLSYGDFAYREVVIRLGRELLGTNFLPILDFLPLEEYGEILSSCSIAIMNQYRQQGLGNVGSIMFRGAKPFLSRRNATAAFLRRHGACLFDVEEIEFSGDAFWRELSAEEKEQNRSTLELLWGDEAIAKNAYAFIDALKDYQAKAVH